MLNCICNSRHQKKIVVAQAWVWLSQIFGVGLLVQPLHIAVFVMLCPGLNFATNFTIFRRLSSTFYDFSVCYDFSFQSSEVNKFYILRFFRLDKQELQFFRFCDFALKKCKIYKLNAFSEFSLNTIA